MKVVSYKFLKFNLGYWNILLGCLGSTG